MRRDFSLSHRGSIYSFLLRIWYNKLKCCSFETVRAQRVICNYLNKWFINDKLLELLVKYHSISKSIATLKRRSRRWNPRYGQKPFTWTSLQLRLAHSPEGYKVLVSIVWKTGAKKRCFKVLYMNTEEEIICIAFKVERKE